MQNDNDRNENVEAAPIPGVLRTVSHEVRNLAIEANDLQNLISNLVVAGAFGGSQSIYELQSLDRLCQNLGAVSDFVNGLANHASLDWKIDLESASEAVKLADVRDRLMGRRKARSESTGDFDDFEDWPLTV